MNQNQVNELLLEALITTELDVTSDITQCKQLIFNRYGYDPIFNRLEKEFDTLFITTCKHFNVFSECNGFPIIGGHEAFMEHMFNLWDMDTEYGQLRHIVYDQMIFTLQDKLGMTE